MSDFLDYYEKRKNYFRIGIAAVVLYLLAVIGYGNNFFSTQTAWKVQNAFAQCAAEGEVIRNDKKPLAPQNCCFGLKPDVYHGAVVTAKVFCY